MKKSAGAPPAWYGETGAGANKAGVGGCAFGDVAKDAGTTRAGTWLPPSPSSSPSSGMLARPPVRRRVEPECFRQLRRSRLLLRSQVCYTPTDRSNDSELVQVGKAQTAERSTHLIPEPEEAVCGSFQALDPYSPYT